MLLIIITVRFLIIGRSIMRAREVVIKMIMIIVIIETFIRTRNRSGL